MATVEQYHGPGDTALQRRSMRHSPAPPPAPAPPAKTGGKTEKKVDWTFEIKEVEVDTSGMAQDVIDIKEKGEIDIKEMKKADVVEVLVTEKINKIIEARPDLTFCHGCGNPYDEAEEKRRELLKPKLIIKAEEVISWEFKEIDGGDEDDLQELVRKERREKRLQERKEGGDQKGEGAEGGEGGEEGEGEEGGEEGGGEGEAATEEKKDY